MMETPIIRLFVSTTDVSIRRFCGSCALPGDKPVRLVPRSTPICDVLSADVAIEQHAASPPVNPAISAYRDDSSYQFARNQLRLIQGVYFASVLCVVLASLGCAQDGNRAAIS
jgi:hypothetical protein